MYNLKKAMIVCLLTATTCGIYGQQAVKHSNWRFQSVNTAGLLEGQAGSAFQLETINGAKYKSWFAGIGAGLDYYRFRSIPLFLSLQKEFGRANSFFAYGNAGTNFFWRRDKDAAQFQVYDKYKNGFFGEAGLGYRFRLSGSKAILFSGGYSYKKITEQGNNFNFYPPGVFIDYLYTPQTINYRLNRVIIKAGIEF